LDGQTFGEAFPGVKVGGGDLEGEQKVAGAF
jgi:hypothetical protein